MLGLKSKQKLTNKKPVSIALESLHGDMCLPFLKKLETELVNSHFYPTTFLLPLASTLEQLRPLVTRKQIGRNPKTGGSMGAYERMLSLENYQQEDQEEKQILLINNGNLSSQAFYATLIPEKADRVSFYRWLDEFEYQELVQERPELTIYIDILPEHLTLLDPPPKPAGWSKEELPEPAMLRNTYLEASKLLPGVKIIKGYENELLLPDQAIYNKIWDLVRRVVLYKKIG